MGTKAKGSILIVDDNPANLDLLEGILSEKGYTVRPTVSGTLALQSARISLPDLILLDIKMPDMNGYEVCRQLKADERTSEVPIIFISALDEPVDILRAFDLGGIDYIAKPFQPEEVLARVKNHLALRNMQKKLEDQNIRLQEEIVERQKAESALQKAHAELEMRVEQRTAELAKANKELQTEIIEHKRAETALQNAEQRYRDFFYEAPVLYVVTGDHNGVPYIVDCNGLFCQTLGYTRDQLLNRPLADLYTPESKNQLMRSGYKDALKGRFAVQERQLVTYDGRLIETLVRAVPALDSDGQVIGTRSIYLDVTERRRVEKALRLSEEKFSKAFRASPVWVAITTVKEGRYLEVNDTFTSITGFTKEEAIGRTAFDLKFWIEPEKDRARALEIFHKQGYFRNLEMQMRFKDGKIHDMLWSAEPIEFGGEDCLLNVLIDITESKKMEAEKLKLETQLMRAQKMEAIGTLAGGIAHDFNNILSAIIGNTEIAMMHELSEGHPARYSMEQVRQAANRATDLVRQILAFSRQKQEEFKPIRIGPIVKEIIKLLRASLPSTIEIRPELTTQADTILGDPSQIHQLLMNLCTNAAHAMHPDGGTLRVGLADIDLDTRAAPIYEDLEPSEYLTLSVSDTGQGMSRATLDRIFEPYFTTKQVGEGTGLGLAVVHGIVKSLKGATQVESETGKGSTFNVFLPKIKRKPQTEIEEKEVLLTGHERILFVDDEQPLTKIGKRMLESLGYEVDAKNSSFEALQVFRDNPNRYDLVITDMTMPGMTGDKLASRILKIRPDIPVILCTGYSELINEDRAKEIGIRELVMKPVLIHEMAKTIRLLLDNGTPNTKP